MFGLAYDDGRSRLSAAIAVGVAIVGIAIVGIVGIDVEIGCLRGGECYVGTDHFPVPSQEGSLENSWSVHQLYTTSDFARKSRFAGFVTGGLNMQVEHHLFPNICSIHYRELAPIIKKTAHDFGVPYLEEPTFWSALGSHVRFLRDVGNIDAYVPTKPTIYPEAGVI